MLRNLADLTYVIRDEVLLITTPEEAEAQLSVRVYPVADLVIPVQSGIGRDDGSMGGGMMGGMGGGMMGGMGGGMMGGMGGMGAWEAWVAWAEGCSTSARLPRQDPRWRFPGVCRRGRSRSLARRQNPVRLPSQTPMTKLDVSLPDNMTATDYWNRHFASHPDVSREAVLEAVDRLMHAQKYDEVIALIEAALRHEQPQSWMYEALALAMQAADRPKDQIERAVMSAVDFADSPLDIMLVGVYLEKLGLPQRALEIYQQVAKMAPLEPEPYVHALGVAERLDDLEGIQWATVGILSQAWTGDRQEVLATSLPDCRGHAASAARGETQRGSRSLSRRRWTKPSSAIASSRFRGRETPTSISWSKSRAGRSARTAIPAPPPEA